MAKIEAVVTADINPFKNALMQATEKAREFANQTKDIGTSVFKSGIGGGNFNLLGFAGAATAATVFGTAVVSALKESLGVFGQMETATLKLKANFHDAGITEEIKQWAESANSIPGRFERMQAAISLKEAGYDPKKIKGTVEDLEKIAFAGNASTPELAEAVRKYHAKGADKGEGASRLLASFPDLEKGIMEEIQQQAKAAELGVTPYDAIHNKGGLPVTADPAKAAELRRMTAEDFVKSKYLDSNRFDDIVHKQAGKLNVSAEKKGSLEGLEARVQTEWFNLMQKMGDKLAPEVEKLLQTIIKNEPKLSSAFTSLGESAGKLVNWINGLMNSSPVQADSLDRAVWGAITGQKTDKNQFPAKMPDEHGNPDLNHRYSLSEVVQQLKANGDENKKTNDLLKEAMTISQ